VRLDLTCRVAGFYHGVFSDLDNRCMCSPGFSGLQCFVACPGVGTAAGVCNGKGACYTSGALEGHCICQSGYGGTVSSADKRASCTDCTKSTALDSPSYFGSGKSGKELVCHLCPGGGTCSGHGTCSAGKQGNGECTCLSGWELGTAKDCGTQVPTCAVDGVSDPRH
jgi:hypothetical protein